MLTNATGKTIALGLFLACGFTCAGQTTSSKPPPQKTVEPVILTTTVLTEKGKFVTRLQRDNFRVFIDKLPADIVDFREEDVPLSVGIVLDASASANFAHWPAAQQALKTFLDTSNPANEYFLMAFNISPQLLLDWTPNSNAILGTLGNVQAKRNTAFYDACYLALDKVRHGRHSKQVLILITDGMDNVSKYSRAQVRNELKASGVLVYSLSFSNPAAGSGMGMEGDQILYEFSSVSGGSAFYRRLGKPMTIADATYAFETMAQELRHQYTIAVTPKVSPNDNKWHKIKIKVEPAADADDEMKHLYVRTREGFYLNQR